MDEPEAEVTTVPLVVYASDGERRVLGETDVNLSTGWLTHRLTNPILDDEAKKEITEHGGFSVEIQTTGVDINQPKEVAYLPTPFVPVRWKNFEDMKQPTELASPDLKQIFPSSQLIDPSHNMGRFSDIPWGCRDCGACECHHLPILCGPCKKVVPNGS